MNKSNFGIIKKCLKLDRKIDRHQIQQGQSQLVDYYERAQSRKIQFTDDQSLYLTQRQGQSFAYTIPIGNEIPENQTYVLVLKFAELFYEEKDSRIFNVLLGKMMILQNIDIFQLVGSFKSHTEYIEFIINGGTVYYQGEPCLGALNNRNELVVGFSASQDQATIAALFLFKGPLKDTDFEDKERFQERWIQRNTPRINEEIKNKIKKEQKILNKNQNRNKVFQKQEKDLVMKQKQKKLNNLKNKWNGHNSHLNYYLFCSKLHQEQFSQLDF